MFAIVRCAKTPHFELTNSDAFLTNSRIDRTLEMMSDAPTNAGKACYVKHC